MGANNEWKKWGEADPYYGVLSHDEFRRENLNEDSYRRFFETGENHVAHVFGVLEDKFGWSSPPRMAIDYGCGTGRLTIPLGRRSDRVVGLDVADGMIIEARANSIRSNVSNVTYELVTNDDSVRHGEPVDLIHSYLVFQHIPPARGEKILRALLGRLRSRGFGALHFTIGTHRSKRQRILSAAHKYVPLAHQMLNAVHRKRMGEPRMRMERYETSRLVQIFSEFGVKSFFCEHTDDGGYIGVLFYFQKP